MALTEIPVLPRSDDTPEAALGRSRRLLDLCVALNVTEHLDALLDRITSAVLPMLRCEAAALLLVDERERVLRFASATGDDHGALSEVVVPLDGSLAGRIVVEDRRLLARDVAVTPDHFAVPSQMTGLQVSTLLGVPLRIDGVVVGVLEALNPTDGRFDAADAEMLEGLAAQASVALRNARQRDALAAANARLTDIDQARSSFLTLASHELRTPLTALRGYADVLRDDVPPPLMPFVHEILAASHRLQDLVETIETMASLRGPDGELAWEAIPVADLFAEARRVAGRPLVTDLTDPSLSVWGDSPRLRLALGQIVRNATAFTPSDGRVTLSAYAAGNEVALRIADTGCGLAAGHLERVFEPFYQVDSSDTRSHEGLGIGLAVSRAVVLRHGGRLWATSDGPERGSTFHMRLPRPAA